MAIISISLPDNVVQKVDTIVKERGFSTRSEFVRSALRDYLVNDERTFQEFPVKPLEEIRLELARTGNYSQEFIESVVAGLSKSSPYAG